MPHQSASTISTHMGPYVSPGVVLARGCRLPLLFCIRLGKTREKSGPALKNARQIGVLAEHHHRCRVLWIGVES